MAGSYKSLGEAGLEFGKKAVTSGLNVLGGQAFGAMAASAGKASTLAGKVVGKAVVTGMQGVTMGMMNNAVNSFYWDGSGIAFNNEQFQESTFGRNAIAGYIGSMAGSAFSTGVTPANGFNAKLWDGFTQLGTMAVTEGAKYATQLAFSYGSGYRGSELFSDAWQHHGGITFNINAGSIMQAAGFLGAVNGTGYSAMEREQYNTWANAFGALGLSITAGANGVSGNLGSGGYDLVNMGFSMAKGLALNKLIKAQAAANPAFAEMFKMTYGYGDFAGEETVWRLLLGKDTLVMDITQSERYKNASDDERAKMLKEAKAITENSDSGGRNIFMQDMQGRGLEGDGAINNMAITLQHEAWRDGKVTADNSVETLRATKAHTMMALELLGQQGVNQKFVDTMLYNDMLALGMGEDVFEEYVKEAYDGNADYWRLKLVDGKIKVGFERDNLTSFAMDESILTSSKLSAKQKGLLIALNRKDFSEYTEDDKIKLKEILIKYINVGNGGGAKMDADDKDAFTQTIISNVMDLGCLVNEITTNPKYLTGISQKEFASFGAGLAYLVNNDLLDKIANPLPNLEGLLDLGDGTIRPFKISNANYFTTLSGRRFDYRTGLFTSAENWAVSHNDAVDLGGYRNVDPEDMGYYMAFNGSISYSISGREGNLAIDMSSDDRQWKYQFLHNSPSTLLDIIEVATYQTTKLNYRNGVLDLIGLQQGTKVGNIGQTGNGNGVHLHGEIRVGANKNFITRFQLQGLAINDGGYSGYKKADNFNLDTDFADVIRAMEYIQVNSKKLTANTSASMESFFAYYGYDITSKAGINSIFEMYNNANVAVPQFIYNYQQNLFSWQRYMQYMRELSQRSAMSAQ